MESIKSQTKNTQIHELITNLSNNVEGIIECLDICFSTISENTLEIQSDIETSINNLSQLTTELQEDLATIHHLSFEFQCPISFIITPVRFVMINSLSYEIAKQWIELTIIQTQILKMRALNCAQTLFTSLNSLIDFDQVCEISKSITEFFYERETITELDLILNDIAADSYEVTKRDVRTSIANFLVFYSEQQSNFTSFDWDEISDQMELYSHSENSFHQLIDRVREIKLSIKEMKTFHKTLQLALNIEERAIIFRRSQRNNPQLTTRVKKLVFEILLQLRSTFDLDNNRVKEKSNRNSDPNQNICSSMGNYLRSNSIHLKYEQIYWKTFSLKSQWEKYEKNQKKVEKIHSFKYANMDIDEVQKKILEEFHFLKEKINSCPYKCKEIDQSISFGCSFCVSNYLNEYLDKKDTEKDKEKLIEYFHQSCIKGIVEIISLFFDILEENQMNELMNSIYLSRTPIQHAIIHLRYKSISYLYKKGADLSIIPSGGNNCYHLAIRDVNMLQFLLQLKDKKSDNEIHAKVIYYSIFEKKNDALEILLKSQFGKYKNTKIMDVTPLQVAASENNSGALDILFKYNSDPLIQVQKDKIVLLQVAAAKGNLDNLKLVVKNLSKYLSPTQTIENFIGYQTEETKMTCIHFAAFRGSFDCLSYLLSLCSPSFIRHLINLQSTSKMTPLFYAISEGKSKCVKTILEFDPDLFVVDENLNNCFTYSGYKNRFYSYLELAKYINKKFHLSSNKSIDEINLKIGKYCDQYREFRNTKQMNDQQQQIPTDDYYHLIMNEKLKQLNLILFDYTKRNEIEVNKPINLIDVFCGLKQIRKTLMENANEVSDNDKLWKKFRSIHLQFIGEIGVGLGVTKQFLFDCSKILLDFDIFQTVFENGNFSHQFNIKKLKELYLENEEIELIGLFCGLSLIYAPTLINYSTAFFDYIFRYSKNDFDYVIKDLIDPEIRFQLKRCKYFSPPEIDDLNLNFTINFTPFNCKELITNGKEINVTKSNFSSYKTLYYKAVWEEMNFVKFYGGFAEGFFSIIPFFFISNVFSSGELKFLLNGKTNFTICEVKKYTRYSNCDETTIEIVWFWELVEKLIQKNEFGKFIEFFSGSQILPVGGFKYLFDNSPFTIELGKNINYLPTSQTCFNTIHISPTENQETFERNFQTVLSNFAGKFQFR